MRLILVFLAALALTPGLAGPAFAEPAVQIAQDPENLRRVGKLKAVVPDRWREFIAPDGKLTPEGLRLIGELDGGTEPPAARPVVQGAPAPDLAAAGAALDRPGVFFDGSGGVAGAPVPAAPRHPSEVLSPNGDKTLVEETQAPGRGLGAAPAGEPAPRPRKEDTPIPGSDWVEAGDDEPVPGKDPATGKDPSSAEKTRFHERLRNGNFWDNLEEEICRKVEIPIDQSFSPVAPLRLSARYHRSIRHLPWGQLAIVDQGKLGIALGHGQRLLELADGLPVTLNFGMELFGNSMVVRPLKSRRTCAEVLRIPDLRDVKSVLPIKAARLRKMQDGEVWKLPVHFRAWLSPGASYGANGVSFGVSFGYSRDGEMSVTLRRLSERELRFRLRIDHAQVYGPGGEVVGRIWGRQFDDYRLDAKDWMGETVGKTPAQYGFKWVDGAVIRVLNRWLTARLGLFAQWMDGDHALMEFVLDPQDESQMKTLEALLAGGDVQVLDTLLKLSRGAVRAFRQKNTPVKELKALERRYAEKLGKDSSFLGTDRSDYFSVPFRLKIPLLLDVRTSFGRQKNHTRLLDEEGGEFHIYRGHRDSDSGLIDIPFMGNLVKHNERRSVLAFGYQDREGRETPPVAVYVHQEGFTFANRGLVKAMVAQANDILQFAGTRGRGVNANTLLPLERIVPAGKYDGPEADAELYRRGVAAFTLLMNDRAVSDIRKASAEEILRAYARTLQDYRLSQGLAWALETGSVEPDGSLRYDRWAAASRFPQDETEHRGGLEETLRRGQALVEDLQKLGLSRKKGHEGEPLSSDKQAKALRDLLAGSSQSALPYDYVLKVLVQLADPRDLYAEFTIQATPWDKGEPKLNGRFLLNRAQGRSELISRMSETVTRFASPSELLD